MQQTLKIIALRLVKHNDRTSVLTAYSREQGLLAFAVPAGAGAGAQRRRALLQPLTPLEVVATLRPDRGLATFREPRALEALHGVLGSPARAGVAMFMAEALSIVLRQSAGEPAMFDFILDATRRLNDPAVAVGNFPLAFLLGLGRMLGIAPEPEGYRPGAVFDMADGCFRLSAPLHGRALGPVESAAAARLLRMNWENMGAFRMKREERVRALELLLEYFTLHYAPLSAMHSPAVLHSLF